MKGKTNKADIADKRMDAMYDISDLIGIHMPDMSEEVRDKIAETLLEKRHEVMDALKKVKEVPKAGLV
ncbi:hypothetical protein [Aeromonas sp. MrichA-1]|uniref:hypothetical protein n=1 Tax=Aeromonas sp. MrichA-1 TaxID=2823362 RepID=UPI001B33929C|nr:hypothetical protein [Aeromonas sp. MrichA-1]MBP4081921.1 hypothetical protein [Aeromonas sp. MrichA-1]